MKIDLVASEWPHSMMIINHFYYLMLEGEPWCKVFLENKCMVVNDHFKEMLIGSNSLYIVPSLTFYNISCTLKTHMLS